MKSNASTVSIVGACIKEGQNWYSGVELAPRALRDAGLKNVIDTLRREVFDAGDHHIDHAVSPNFNVTEEFYNPGSVNNVAPLGRTLEHVYESVKRESDKRNFVLTLGGDHSVAAASISAMKQSCDTRATDLAVVWVDAHADCNIPETSDSGNFHGMPVGMLLGWFSKKLYSFEWIEEYLKSPLAENRLAFIGLRDVDEKEKELLRKSKILVYSMMDVDRMGIASIMEEISQTFSGCQLHLSFDIDGIDPTYAPGTGTRAKGGLNYREARYICSSLASTGRLMSMDLVEVNPSLDDPVTEKHEHGDNLSVCPSASPTIKLAIDLIEFALGKTLL